MQHAANDMPANIVSELKENKWQNTLIRSKNIKREVEKKRDALVLEGKLRIYATFPIRRILLCSSCQRTEEATVITTITISFHFSD